MQCFFKQQQQQNKIRDLEEQILNSNQINIDSLNERDIKFEELSTRSVFLVFFVQFLVHFLHI